MVKLMKIYWKKGYCPQLIASRLESSANRSDSKVVSFDAIESDACQSMLYSMLEFKPPYSIPEIDARRIVWKAAVEAGGKGKITEDSLLAEIKRLANEHMELPLERYVLATSLIHFNSGLPMAKTKRG